MIEGQIRCHYKLSIFDNLIDLYTKGFLDFIPILSGIITLLNRHIFLLNLSKSVMNVTEQKGPL